MIYTVAVRRVVEYKLWVPDGTTDHHLVIAAIALADAENGEINGYPVESDNPPDQPDHYLHPDGSVTEDARPRCPTGSEIMEVRGRKWATNGHVVIPATELRDDWRTDWASRAATVARWLTPDPNARRVTLDEDGYLVPRSHHHGLPQKIAGHYVDYLKGAARLECPGGATGVLAVDAAGEPMALVMPTTEDPRAVTRSQTKEVQDD